MDTNRIYSCASCGAFACENQGKDNPDICPMNVTGLSLKIKDEYSEDENREFFINAAKVESEGYGNWNRVRETIELCRRMGYRRIGIAFCAGLLHEANTVMRLFRERGFEVVSVKCKAGGNDKCEFGIDEEDKIEKGFEPACNPIGQAAFLASCGVEFAVVIGLCVGHDSLFYKYFSRYSDAFCTTLVAKDRVTGNNPCAAIYGANGYFRDRFGDK